MNTTFETVKSNDKKFGTNAYLEVAQKRLTENEEVSNFLLLTRGYVNENGDKRWTKFVTLPMDVDALAWIVTNLRSPPITGVTYKFATNSYIEIEHKEWEEADFVVLTRGFFGLDGEKRWTRFIMLPAEEEVLAWVANEIGVVHDRLVEGSL